MQVEKDYLSHLAFGSLIARALPLAAPFLSQAPRSKEIIRLAIIILELSLLPDC